MIIASLLLSWLAFAGAQLYRPYLDEAWSDTYPEILSPRINERAFRDNKEYRYIYNGQILTGLPEASDQYSGLRIRAVFTIQLRTGVDVFKIEKATLGRINERNIVGGPLKLQPLQDFEELTGEEAKEWETALTKSLRFEYIDGTVTNMVAMESDPFWSVNIKRSILATFNLSLKPVSSSLNSKVLSGFGRPDVVLDMESSEYFTVTEEGIGGECEATYIIQSIPSGPWSGVMTMNPTMRSGLNILNVTKTWDYTKCMSRPIDVQSMNNPIKCESTMSPSMCMKSRTNNLVEKDKDNIIDSAAHTRYNIVGSRSQYIVESANTEAVHKFTPTSDAAGSVSAYVNATMKLIYSGDWSRDSILPTDSGITLKGLRQLFPKYTKFMDNQYAFESDLSNKPFLQSIGQWPNVQSKKLVVKALMDKLVEDLSDNEVEPESANLVLQLSVILQYATPEEITEIHQTVKSMSHQSFEHEQIQKLWFDVLALSGTKPALLFIKREIASGKLVGERAAQILNTLAFSVLKPDQDVVGEILDLCKMSTVTSHSNLRKACWLTFGTLAHTSCVEDLETTDSIQNTIVKPGSPVCSSDVRRRFALEIVAKMKATRSEEEQLLMLKTLGNTGFIEALPELKAIFADDSRSVTIRTHAIFATVHMTKNVPELVTAALMPEFFDVTNPSMVRIAAFDLILEAKPELPDLEVIARSLHNEKSVQVGSYIYSKLNSIANSTHPCFEQIAKDASIALEFAKPFHTGLSFSKGFHFGKFSEELGLGGFAEVSTVPDPSSVFPRGLYFRLNSHVFGFSHDLIEGGFETDGVNQVLQRLFMSRADALTNPASVLEFMDEGEDMDASMVGTPMANRRAGRKMWNRPELDEIDRILGIADIVDQEVRGTAYLKIFGQEVRYLTLTPKSLIRLVTDAYLKPSEVVGLVNGGLPVDYRKAFMAADTEINIPTELGLPLTIELKIPVVVSAKGLVGLKTVPSLSMSALANVPHSVSIASDVSVSIASEVHGKMSVWAAFMKAGAGVIGKVSTVIPLEGAISLDIKTGKIQSTFEIPEKPLELLNVEIMPMTFTKVVPKVLVPHMPDVKNPFDVHQSEKIIQFNRPPLANEIPKSLFGFSTKMEENPFMLSQSGRYNTDFYRGLPVPVLDIKEISTFDVIKTKSVDTFLGHPALGVMVKVNGQVQMASGVPTAPVVPVGGKNRLVVTLMPLPGVGLKSIKTTLNIRQQDFASTAKPTWNPLYDQLLGYNVNNIVGRLNENVPMDFGKTDKKGFSTQLIVQGIRDSNQEVAMQGVFSWIRGMDGKFVKIAAEFISPHPQISYQTCLYGHAEYPSDYNTWTLTPGINNPITGRFELSFGKTCSSPDATKIKAAFTGDKSPMQIHLEKNDYYTVEGTVIPQVISKTVEPLARSMKPVYRECENDRKRGVWFSSACQAVKDIYSTLMQMKIDINYQNIPYGLEKLLSKAENLVHSMYFWNSEIDDVRVKNTPNKLTILVDFTSADERVDLVYSTPQKNAKLLNMPVPYPVAPISADQKPMDFWEMVFGEDLDEMCTVMGEELNTLDSAEIRVPFSECYHLLAKDCSVEEAWSVMYASAGSRYGESKKVMAFIGGKKIEMIPAESITSRLGTGADMIIRVDGRVISGSAMTNLLLDDEELDITIETQGNGLAPYYKISAEQYGIEFWFDGHNIALKPTFWLRNQICGLCGNNNGEEWDDMMLPSGKFADSIPDLMRGYMVVKDGCGQELKDISRMNRMSLFPASSFENSKLLVQNLAMSENEMIRIAAQHMGTALTSNSASPLNLILSVADLNRYMLDLLSGKVISGSECLARSVELANVVGNLKMQAGSVLGSNVFGPVTPERKYQTVVQRMGSALIAVLQAAAENPSAANTDKYMQIIVKMANNIHRIQGVVARQDTSLECLEASKAAAVILQSVRASLSDSGNCDKLKNIVRTKPGQVCFSLEALPDCPELCPMDDQDNREEDFALFKRVAFHCLPEESTVAQRLLREVDTRVLTEISQKPANDYFSVPKPGSCSMSNSSFHRMSRKERLMWV